MIKIITEKKLNKLLSDSARDSACKIKFLNADIKLDTFLLLKLSKGYTREDFVTEYGDRSIQGCFSWSLACRLMPVYFPEVQCKYVAYSAHSKWEASVHGCLKIDPVKVKMKDLPDILALMEPCTEAQNRRKYNENI